MITRSPYRDAEFLRSVYVVPYDPEAEEAAARFAEQQACRAYARTLEQKRRREDVRQFLIGLTFAFCALAAAFIWSLV